MPIKPVRVQLYLALLSVVLFAAKIIAWYLTGSVTVLTDALEGIVNVIAGFLGLFSMMLAAIPRDTNHPYGHGKAEFLSSAVEGTLIIISSVFIIYDAVLHLLHPHLLQRLDAGLVIVAAAGTLNYLAGRFAYSRGVKGNSMILQSAGKHLISDAYSTIAIITGLLVLVLTGNKYPWLDSVVALCFSLIILVTGYRVLRRSLSGIMDEMDLGLLAQVIEVVQENRKPQWVDLHNLRVIQYGNLMHIDAHMSLPWYFKVSEAEAEIKELERLIKSRFGDQVELFIHIDGCKSFQCSLCSMPQCAERQAELVKRLEWTTEILWANEEHGSLNLKGR